MKSIVPSLSEKLGELPTLQEDSLGPLETMNYPFYCKIQLQSHFNTKSLSYIKNNCSDPNLNEKKPLILLIYAPLLTPAC